MRIHALLFVILCGGATAAGPAVTDDGLQTDLVRRMGEQLLRSGPDKLLHYNFSLLLTQSGPGGRTDFGGNLRNLLFALALGLDKELQDVDATDAEHEELARILYQIDRQLRVLDRFVLEKRLNQGDLLADQIGAGLGITLQATHQLDRRN